MKKTTIVGLVLAIIMCMTGCNSEPAPITTDTISLLEEDALTYTIISDFSDPSYDLGELIDMAQDEVEEYGAGVQISNAVVENGTLQFVYTFASVSDYEAFMGTSCFKGTVDQALQEGFKSDTVLTSAKGKASVILGTESIGRYHLFVWNEDISVRCDGRILYHSSNLTISDKTDAHPKDGAAGPYYVICK